MLEIGKFFHVSFEHYKNIVDFMNTFIDRISANFQKKKQEYTSADEVEKAQLRLLYLSKQQN